jgi:hypothetical protein
MLKINVSRIGLQAFHSCFTVVKNWLLLILSNKCIQPMTGQREMYLLPYVILTFAVSIKVCQEMYVYFSL